MRRGYLVAADPRPCGWRRPQERELEAELGEAKAEAVATKVEMGVLTRRLRAATAARRESEAAAAAAAERGAEEGEGGAEAG